MEGIEYTTTSPDGQIAYELNLCLGDGDEKGIIENLTKLGLKADDIFDLSSWRCMDKIYISGATKIK